MNNNSGDHTVSFAGSHSGSTLKVQDFSVQPLPVTQEKIKVCQVKRNVLFVCTIILLYIFNLNRIIIDMKWWTLACLDLDLHPF